MKTISTQDLTIIREIIQEESYSLGLITKQDKIICEELLISGGNNYAY